MRRAFILALLVSFITPLIGNVIVLKRLSTVGDALSHAGLAGVAIGLCFGFDPVIGAVVVSILAGLSIEFIRREFARYSEIANSIVMSLAIGLAAVFSGFVKNSASFNSFLFGSIVAVSNAELAVAALLSAVVALVFFAYYRQLFYITFDEEGAVVAGVKTQHVNLIFTTLTAIVVSVSARSVGALIISSLLVLPVACAMQVSHSYKSNILYSIGFALLFTLTGLTLSYYLDLKPGGTIVLVAIAVLFAIIGVKKICKE